MYLESALHALGSTGGIDLERFKFYVVRYLLASHAFGENGKWVGGGVAYPVSVRKAPIPVVIFLPQHERGEAVTLEHATQRSFGYASGKIEIAVYRIECGADFTIIEDSG